jgi:hypothetical protein
MGFSILLEIIIRSIIKSEFRTMFFGGLLARYLLGFVPYGDKIFVVLYIVVWNQTNHYWDHPNILKGPDPLLKGPDALLNKPFIFLKGPDPLLTGSEALTNKPFLLLRGFDPLLTGPEALTNKPLLLLKAANQLGIYRNFLSILRCILKR